MLGFRDGCVTQSHTILQPDSGNPSENPVNFISGSMRTRGGTGSVSGNTLLRIRAFPNLKRKSRKSNLHREHRDGAGCYVNDMLHHTMKPPPDGEFAAASAKFQKRQSHSMQKKGKKKGK